MLDEQGMYRVIAHFCHVYIIVNTSHNIRAQFDIHFCTLRKCPAKSNESCLGKPRRYVPWRELNGAVAAVLGLEDNVAWHVHIGLFMQDVNL